MKVKALLATTALAAVFSSGAFADDMAVKMAGKLNFQYGNASQSSAYKDANKAAGNTASKFDSRGAVTLNAEGKNEALTYGANIRLNTVGTMSDLNKSTKKARTYLYLESNFGRVEMGSNYSVAKLMRVSSDCISRATGGAVNGDWMNFVSLPTTNGTDYYTSNQSWTSAFGGKESSRKLSWMSPSYNGVQFGLSYTPDNRNEAASVDDDRMTYLEHKNVYALAVNYANNFDAMNLALSAVYESGSLNKKATKTKEALGDKGVGKGLKSYSVGFVLGTNSGFSVAGSYLNEGKTGTMTTDKTGVALRSGSAVAYDFGVAYANGPVGVSLTYLNAKAPVNDAATATTAKKFLKTSVYALGADYQMAPGLMAYAEVNRFNMKPTPATDANKNEPNKGTVVLLGMELGF